MMITDDKSVNTVKIISLYHFLAFLEVEDRYEQVFKKVFFMLSTIEVFHFPSKVILELFKLTHNDSLLFLSFV